MKYYPFVLLITLAFAACGSSKKTEGTSSQIIKPEEGGHHLDITVKVDGDLNEWPEPLPGYSKEAALHFGVTNNKDALFIAVACADERMQTKILRSGMEIYIGENGKKETSTGIAFPLPSANAYHPAEGGTERTPQRPDIKQERSSSSRNLTQLKTFGLKELPDGEYSLSNLKEIKIAYNWSANNFFNIEYAIPLKELFADATLPASKSIEIGFKLNSFAEGERNRQSGSYGGGGMRSGGRSGGGMRGGGGGVRGGGMRQGGEERQGEGQTIDITKEQRFWTKYTIALNQ